RLYQAGAREKVVFEGSLEITPFFQRDIDALRRVSPRFLFVLVAGFTGICVTGSAAAEASPAPFTFLLGMGILLQLMVHTRHVRGYVAFRAMSTDAIRGRIEYSRPYLLKQSSIEIATFAVLYAVVFLFTDSLFVLGGAFGCAVVAIQHWFLMRRA